MKDRSSSVARAVVVTRDVSVVLAVVTLIEAGSIVGDGSGDEGWCRLCWRWRGWGALSGYFIQ